MSSVFDITDIIDRPKPVKEKVRRSRKREGLSRSSISTGQRTMMQMVETAFETLEDALEFADYPTAIKAAQIILDRSGFGPKSTVDINQTTVDLSTLSRAELADRASRVAEMLRKTHDAELVGHSKSTTEDQGQPTIN